MSNVRSSFEKLYNFRDVGRSESKIKEGKLFRGANLCFASEDDATILINTLNIRTFIDMRRPMERGVDSNGIILGPLHSHIFTPNSNFRYYNIPLTQSISFSLAILLQTSPFALAHAFYLGLCGNTKEMEKRISQSALEGKSLSYLYSLFLINSGNQILKVLLHLIDEDNYPVVIFCSGGKDRTGIISMLVQACCGDDPQLIIDSYHQSEENLKIVEAKIRLENEREGLDADLFLTTPKHAMENLIAFIKQRWGGIPQYLNSIGFDEPKQTKLRNVLTL